MNHVTFSTRINRGLALASLSLLLATGCRLASNERLLDGKKLYNTGQFNNAQQRFQQALQTDPKNADGYYNLAVTQHRLAMQNQDANTLRQAEQLYQQALALNPNVTDYHRGYAVLLTQTSRTNDAYQWIENWARRNPQAADPRIELARLYEESGDLRTAELHLQEALQLEVGNPRAHIALAHLREQAGDIPQAIVNYERAYAIRNDPAVAQQIASLRARTASRPSTSPPRSAYQSATRAL